ncbi:MAG: phage holin family protein [Motilibacteraceae bacterium]
MSTQYPQGTTGRSGASDYADVRTDRASTDTSGSIGELIKQVTDDLSTLVRQEMQLARAEMMQSAKRAGTGAGMLGGAGFAGYFVLLFLSISLWWAIGDGIGYGWSALIVAVLWAIVAAVLAVTGKKKLAETDPVPRRTVETAKEIPQALKPDPNAPHETTGRHSA